MHRNHNMERIYDILFGLCITITVFITSYFCVIPWVVGV